jgi:hypothetical protein
MLAQLAAFLRSDSFTGSERCPPPNSASSRLRLVLCDLGKDLPDDDRVPVDAMDEPPLSPIVADTQLIAAR